MVIFCTTKHTTIHNFGPARVTSMQILTCMPVIGKYTWYNDLNQLHIFISSFLHEFEDWNFLANDSLLLVWSDKIPNFVLYIMQASPHYLSNFFNSPTSCTASAFYRLILFYSFKPLCIGFFVGIWEVELEISPSLILVSSFLSSDSIFSPSSGPSVTSYLLPP